jgi:hypothetical protein
MAVTNTLAYYNTATITDVKNIYSNGSRCGSTGVEHSTINPEIIGSNLATA